MGLLTKLLTLPVMGPHQRHRLDRREGGEQAEKELYDEETVRWQLIELELRYDLGEFGEEEYLAAEEALLERLRVIRERQAAERET